MQYTNIFPDFGVRNITFVIYRGIRRQELGAWGLGQSSVQWPRFHERKYLALQARQIELPRLSSRGPLMFSRQSAVRSLQSAVGSRQSSVQWPCFHERKYLALQARQIELPRLSSRGPLMFSRQFPVCSPQSAVGSNRYPVISRTLISTNQPINLSAYKLISL